jgi:hypothetical protein
MQKSIASLQFSSAVEYQHNSLENGVKLFLVIKKYALTNPAANSPPIVP